MLGGVGVLVRRGGCVSEEGAGALVRRGQVH